MSFWEKIDPPTFVAGLMGTCFVLVAFVLAAVVIRKTEKSDDVEILRQRFAQVMFVGILTLFIFTSILYFLSPEKSVAGEAIFNKAVTAMTPLAGVIIGYLFGSKTDRTQTEQKPSEGSTQTVRPR